jgi:hypothetical protein
VLWGSAVIAGILVLLVWTGIPYPVPETELDRAMQERYGRIKVRMSDPEVTAILGPDGDLVGPEERPETGLQVESQDRWRVWFTHTVGVLVYFDDYDRVVKKEMFRTRSITSWPEEMYRKFKGYSQNQDR